MSRFDADDPEARRSLVTDAVAAHRARGSLFCTFEADGPPSESRAGDAETDSETSDVAESDAGADASETGADAERSDTGADASEHDADAATTDADPLADDEPTPAWVQFSGPEGQLNLDCTDEEYDRLTGVLSEFPEFTVQEQTAPEDAEGRNLRIEAWADDERIAAVIEQLFVDGFGYDEDVRLWVTEL